MTANTKSVLLTGATGYVGRLLLPRLLERGLEVRCLVRDPSKLSVPPSPLLEVAQGDVLDSQSLAKALQGIDTAYYLVHLMAGDGAFEDQDRQAAKNFAPAARETKLKRIIYLGGLGDESSPNLSAHLRSRHEVGAILRDSGVETIEFRAAMIVGAGSLSYQLLKSLTDRLPVMLCPRWLTTPTQPIAIDDVLRYLVAALDLPPSGSRVFEIGGPDVVAYMDLIREYARQKKLRRWLITVPLLTPHLSGLWLALVTPATYRVGRHLIEGLRNPMVVSSDEASKAFPIRPVGIQEAMRRAIAEDRQSGNAPSIK
ncbi:NAD(P)H-binding protein [bacterium]|nr:NAD(P)H-binding protein [bacterium]